MMRHRCCRLIAASATSLLVLACAATGTEHQSSNDAHSGTREAPSAASTAVPLVNAGFESETFSAQGGPEAWSGTQHAGEPAYRFTLDTTTRRSGKRSLRVENIADQPFGAMEQRVPAAALAGRKVRFSGWLKTRNANDGGAVLSMVAEGHGGGIVAHNFMGGAEAKGSREWQRYSIVLAVPPHASSLRVGVMLLGTGTVWFDDAELEILSS